MIPADIEAEIAGVVRAAVAAGDLPDRAGGLSAAGTWRRAPAPVGDRPGTYATSLPFEIARLTGGGVGPAATLLAAGLGAVAWVASARATGGYVTVTVTAGHLAALPGRIVAAGPAVVRSGALAGRRLTAPFLANPAAAPGWDRAWRTQRDALAGRLGEAAGATVLFVDLQRNSAADSPAEGPVGPVAAAVARYGAEAVRYALARTAAVRPRAIEHQAGLPLDLANPFFAVRYAHAAAASTLRWAGDLGLPPRGEVGQLADTELLTPELAVIDAMSWLPERVAAAARRARPAELAACLEHVAGSWLDCAERCPALPFSGAAAPADPGGPAVAARLRIADAVRVVLAAGLELLGLAAPARM